VNPGGLSSDRVSSRVVTVSTRSGYGVENTASLSKSVVVSMRLGKRSFSSQLREKDSIDDPLLPFLAEVHMYDLQGKFHSFGWSYANIATSLMGGPLVMCRSGRSAKDASFRLGACPLLLLLPIATLPKFYRHV
jgi:hypothetical protein